MYVFLQSYLECTIDTKTSAYLTVLLTDMIHSDATQKHVSINTRMVGYHQSHSTCAYTRLYMYHVQYMQYSVCIYTCICTCNVHTHTNVYACTCMYMYNTCMCMYVHVLYIHIPMYMYNTCVCMYCTSHYRTSCQS